MAEPLPTRAAHQRLTIHDQKPDATNYRPMTTDSPPSQRATASPSIRRTGLYARAGQGIVQALLPMVR